MQILSFVLNIIGLACMISASLIKGKNIKKILFFVFCGNFLVATGYLAGGSGINGAASCYLGAAQAIINYFFESKGKSTPKWLVALYALAFIAVNIAVGGINVASLIAIVACLVFILCIGQKNGAKYRFWTILNNLLWIIYDIYTKSYGALTSHVPILIFTVTGMIIHDRKKEDKND